MDSYRSMVTCRAAYSFGNAIFIALSMIGFGISGGCNNPRIPVSDAPTVSFHRAIALEPYLDNHPKSAERTQVFLSVCRVSPFSLPRAPVFPPSNKTDNADCLNSVHANTVHLNKTDT